MHAEASRPRQVKVTRAMGAAMRRIHVGNALGAFGSALPSPSSTSMWRRYGLGSMTAGLVLAVFAVAALVVLPFAGRAIVLRGPLPVLLTALVTAAFGALSLGLASNSTAVLLSAAALGAGQAVMQPALATMIVDCSTADTRSRAFATQFFLQNLGLGVGGLIGGHIVDTTRASSFTLLFAIEAAMFLVLVVIMATVRVPHAPRIEGDAPQAEGGSWKQLLGNRAMVQLSVLGFGAVLRLLRAVRVGAVGVRRRGGRDLDLGARYGDGGEHGDDRGGAVRGAEVRRAPEAVAGDRGGGPRSWAWRGWLPDTRGWDTAAGRWRRPRSSRRTGAVRTR